MPSFLFLFSLVGKTLGRGTGSHCPPATISKPFILPLQRGESKSKGDKSVRPTKDIEKRGKEGRVVGERGRAERKPCGPNKSLKPASPKDQTVETQGQEESRPHGDRQPGSQGGEGVKEDETPVRAAWERVEKTPNGDGTKA